LYNYLWAGARGARELTKPGEIILTRAVLSSEPAERASIVRKDASAAGFVEFYSTS